MKNFLCFLLTMIAFSAFGQDPEGAKRFTNQMIHGYSVHTVAFSPDGTKAFSGSHNNILKSWEINSGKEIKSYKFGSISVAIGPDGLKALSSGMDKTFNLWDMNSGDKIKTFTGHRSGVSSVTFSPDGTKALSVGYDKIIKLWDINSGKKIKSFAGHRGSVNSATFSPDGTKILSGSNDYTVKLWDIQSGNELKSFAGHRGSVNSATFSPDGTKILSGSDDYTVKLWDIQSGNELKSFAGHRGSVNSATFSPDGMKALSGSSDGKVKLWDINLGKEIKTSMGHDGLVQSVAISIDGTKVISGSNDDNTIKVWDIQSWNEVKIFDDNYGISSLDISSDGATIAYSTHYGKIRVFDLLSNKQLYSFDGYRDRDDYDIIKKVCLSSDASKLLFLYESVFKVWDKKTNSIREFPNPEFHSTHTITINSDGSKIVCGGQNGSIHVINLNNNTYLELFYFDSVYNHSSIKQLCINTDGSKIVSSGDDNIIRLWEADSESGKEKKNFFGHKADITSIALSKDETKIISGSLDSTIKIWDVKEGVEVKSIVLNEIPIHLSFSHDDKQIRVGTRRYWTTFPIDEEKKIVTNQLFSPNSKIIFTNPNARKYLKESLKTNQEKLTIEAIISYNLKESELKTAIKVFINGNLQTGKLGTVSLTAQQQDYDFEQTLELEEGANKIEIVVAAPNQEVVRSIPLNVFYTPPQKANLYLLTFGVQHSDLEFTDEDAQAIHRLFKSQQGTLFNQVFAEGPFIREHTDTKTIAQELESLGYRDEIREQDVVLVFGSSHGDIINDDFRILGSDWRPNAPKNSSLSFREDIIGNLNHLKCKKIILLDACHSGATVGKRLLDANQIIANTPVGTITITSSSGTEKSYENKVWNNSAFVKAIKEALEEGKANTNNDRYVTLQELFDYLQKRVPNIVKSVKELEKFSQTPQMKMEGMQDFPIYLVK